MAKNNDNFLREVFHIRKKHLFSLLTLAAMAFLTVGLETDSRINAQAKPNTAQDAKASQDSPATSLQIYLLQGRADTLDCKLGEEIDQVALTYGKPLTQKAGKSMELYCYKNFAFVTWKSQKAIDAIIFYNDFEVFGIKNNMTKDEVKKVLGEPNQEDVVDDQYEEDRMLNINQGDSDFAYYVCGKYNIYSFTVYFAAKTGLVKKVIISSSAND